MNCLKYKLFTVAILLVFASSSVGFNTVIRQHQISNNKYGANNLFNILSIARAITYSDFLGITSYSNNEKQQKKTDNKQKQSSTKNSNSIRKNNNNKLSNSCNSNCEQSAGGSGGDDDKPPKNIDNSQPKDKVFFAKKKISSKEAVAAIASVNISESAAISLVKQFLEDNDSSINAVDDNGYTMLHMAAKRGHVDLVEYLLDRYADPNIPNNDGQIPLILALTHANDKNYFSYDDDENNNDEETNLLIVDLLIDAGSELFTQFIVHNNNGYRVLEVLEEGSNLYYKLHKIHQQRRIRVLQNIWNSLSSSTEKKSLNDGNTSEEMSTLQKKSIDDFSIICYFLGIDARDVDEELSIISNKKRSKILKAMDAEFVVAQKLMNIIERKINLIDIPHDVYNNSVFVLLDRATYQLIEYFRELSLSSVDIVGDQGLSGGQKGDIRQFTSHFQDEDSQLFKKSIHRLPYTLAAVLRKQADNSKKKLFLGRTASRNKASVECEHRFAASSSQQLEAMAKMNQNGQNIVSSSTSPSLRANRKPQNCAEYQAFARAQSTADGSLKYNYSFDAVKLSDMVCDYRFTDCKKDKRNSKAANPQSLKPCANCKKMYEEYTYQGKPS